MNFLDLYPRGEGFAGALKGALTVLGLVGVVLLSGVAWSQIGMTNVRGASSFSALRPLRVAIASGVTPNLIAIPLMFSFACAV